MSDKEIIDWLTSTTPASFWTGILILVLGGSQLLSKDNLQRSLGGLTLPFEWARNKRERDALAEATEKDRLRSDNSRLNREITRHHNWAIYATKRIRQLEGELTEAGVEIPPPRFVYLHEFKGEEDDDE